MLPLAGLIVNAPDTELNELAFMVPLLWILPVDVIVPAVVILPLIFAIPVTDNPVESSVALFVPPVG